MIPPELIERHRQAQQSIVTLANQDLVTAWRRLDPTDAVGLREALIPALREVTGAYGELAAVAAADFYEDARSVTAAPGRYRARAATPAPLGQVDAMTRWALGPMFSTNPRPNTTLTKLAGGTSRLVRQAERETLAANIGRENIRYARTPAIGSDCDFCLMLASRGAVYLSEETASTVGATARPRGRRGYIPEGYGRTGGGGKPRPAGSAFHDHCRCQVVPVWTDDDLPAFNRELQDEWNTATAGHHDQLAAWREHVAATRN